MARIGREALRPVRGAGSRASFTDRLQAWPQVPLPHHLISWVVFRLARWRLGPIKNLAIRLFVRAFRVDLSEAEEGSPSAYPDFNAFFTRALKEGARPVVGGEGEIACPVDGSVSQVGRIEGGRIFQAKGIDYSLAELLGEEEGEAERSAPFRDGVFATLYLSPRDYHRIHMPLQGRLREMVHLPGRLFSVNPATARAVPRLFARNERVAAIFDTEAGPMALVLVGAASVAGIETVWHGLVAPPRGRKVRTWTYGDEGPSLGRGEEMGRFNLGSTVIVLFSPETVEWAKGLKPGAEVRMGRLLGRVLPAMSNIRKL